MKRLSHARTADDERACEEPSWRAGAERLVGGKSVGTEDTDRERGDWRTRTHQVLSRDYLPAGLAWPKPNEVLFPTPT